MYVQGTEEGTGKQRGLGATGRHLGQGRTADGREQRITAAEKAKLRGSGRDLPGRRVELEGVGI